MSLTEFYVQWFLTGSDNPEQDIIKPLAVLDHSKIDDVLAEYLYRISMISEHMKKQIEDIREIGGNVIEFRKKT